MSDSITLSQILTNARNKNTPAELINEEYGKVLIFNLFFSRYTAYNDICGIHGFYRFAFGMIDSGSSFVISHQVSHDQQLFSAIYDCDLFIIISLDTINLTHTSYNTYSLSWDEGECHFKLAINVYL